jgi:tetratricopeptide (TPR) repeat protein
MQRAHEGLDALVAGEPGRAAELLRQAAVEGPADAAVLANLGTALQQLGQLDEAIASYRHALRLEPSSADIRYNLGAAERAAGNPAAAVHAYRGAIELRSDFVEAHNNLGLALLDWGQPGAAVVALAEACALSPRSAAIHANLGNALRADERLSEAMASYRRAVALDPGCGEAWFNLHAMLFDRGDLGGAAQALERALEARPQHAPTLFFLGVVRHELGDDPGAARCFAALEARSDPPRHLLDSWAYVCSERTPRTRLFAHGQATLAYALAQAEVRGLVLELGVRFGASIRFIAGRARQIVHGLDSFQGLPEAWGPLPAGTYSTRGELPEVPPNVELHVGDFSRTLPVLLAREPGPLRFANVDCDLYRSTLVALDVLADRIVPGTVLCFDEYLAYPGWREGELAAFREAGERHGWQHEWLAVSLFSKQAVVRIVDRG